MKSYVDHRGTKILSNGFERLQLRHVKAIIIELDAVSSSLVLLLDYKIKARLNHRLDNFSSQIASSVMEVLLDLILPRQIVENASHFDHES